MNYRCYLSLYTLALQFLEFERLPLDHHHLRATEYLYSHIYPITRSILLQLGRGAHHAIVCTQRHSFSRLLSKKELYNPDIHECRSQNAGTNGADAERGIAPLKAEPVSFVHCVSLPLLSLSLSLSSSFPSSSLLVVF